MSSQPSLAYLPASELARRIKAREISSVEATETVIARAEASQSTLNAFATICKAEALAAAHKADEAVRLGEATGPLHGVPVSVKDLLDVQGERPIATALPLYGVWPWLWKYTGAAMTCM